MQQTPLIVFAFAHERSESNPPVRNLLKEQLQVTSLIAPLVQKKYCETQAVVNVSVDRLNQLIEREGDRLIGIHYASDVATLLRSREGKEKSMERALKGKLGRKLGALPHLKWIFLSGDGGQEQTESLIKAGVPLVIRSHNLINDDAAFRLAYFFYQSLGQGLTLGKSCERSVAEVRRDYVNKAKLTYEHEPPSGYGSDWPFSYHVNPFVESPLWWSVQHARGQEGDGLPQYEAIELPALPFTDFAPLDSSFSSLFVGHEREARSIYEVITSQQGPPIIVISGAPKSGISSFVQAGLPLSLSKDYQYRYHRFKQDALTTLSLALSADEDLSLTRTWLEQEGGEERVLLQPQVITELMNEAQSSFRTHYRSEKADFTQFLRAVRAMWMRDEMGEGDNLLNRLSDLFSQQAKMSQEEEELNTDLRPLVVCIDQLEHMFGTSTALVERRHERFWEVLKQLCFNPDRPLRGALILCVSAERLLDLTNALDLHRLSYEKIAMDPLSKEHIEAYLQRFRSSNRLKERFPLMIDEQLPSLWAQKLAGSNPTELGLCFHEMFRVMWRGENKRPLLLNAELLNRYFEEAPSLSTLLLGRVKKFTQLMRAQGDDELSEEFALDLIYRMTESVEEGLIDVSTFLQEYLSWNISLPEPWGSRQKSLGDQSLWVISQAIDLGLFVGQVKAGVSLPSGSLSLIHPRLKEVVRIEWSETLGHFNRAIMRLSDFSKSNLPPAEEDIQLATQAFEQMRLPTMEEAELLLRGLAKIEEALARTSVTSKRDQVLQIALIFGLILTMGRCAQVGGSYEELSANRGRVDDQLRLLAAERSLSIGETDLAASLLAEVKRPTEREAWHELALKSLNTPLADSRLVTHNAWSEVLITPRALKVTDHQGRSTLWSGAELRESHRLGIPQRYDHTLSGLRWVSFEEGMLHFWSIDQPQATSKRLSDRSLKDLKLNHEGTIAAVLSESGVVSLHRSYEYPVKEFMGLNNQPIKEIKISPNREHLMLIDQEGGIQCLVLSEDRIEMSVPRSVRFMLQQSAWLASDGARLVTLEIERGQDNNKDQNQQVIVHTNGQEPKVIYQGRKSISKLHSSPHLPQIALEKLTASHKSLVEFYDLRDRVRNIPQLNLDAKSLREVVFDPSGEKIVLIPDLGQGSAVIFTLRERLNAIKLSYPNIDQIGMVRITQDGTSVLGMVGDQVIQWKSDDGGILKIFERHALRPLSIEVIGDSAQIAFSSSEIDRAELLSWSLSTKLLSETLSSPEEEITQALWSKDGIIFANQRGEITLWDEQKRAPRVKFNAHQDRVSVMHLMSDGNSFVSASANGSISKWSTLEGKPLARFQGHESGVTAISTPMNASLEVIATADQRGEVWIWSGSNGAGRHFRAAKARIQHLRLSPQAKYLVTIPANGQQRSAVWNVGSGGDAQSVAALPTELCDAQWRGQGSELELLLLDCLGTIYKWTPRGGRPEPLFNASDTIGQVKFQIASFDPSGSYFVGVNRRGQAHLGDLRRQTIIPISVKRPISNFSFISVTDNERPHIVIGGKQGEVWLWRDQALISLGELEGAITGIVHSQDKQSIMTYSEGDGIYWDGVFDQNRLVSRLHQQSRVCLNPKERLELLDESLAEAKAQYQTCRNRIAEFAKTR